MYLPYLIRSPLCRRPLVLSLSVRNRLSRAYLVSLWSNQVHTSPNRVPFCKGYAVTRVSRVKVEVMVELYTKSLSGVYLLFTWSNMAHTSLTECLWAKNVPRTWIKVVSQGSTSYQTMQKCIVQSIYTCTFHLALFDSYFK